MRPHSGLVWLCSLDGIVRAVWLRLRASQPSCVAGGHRQGLLEAQAEIERITHGDELLLVSNDHDVYVDGVKGAMLEFFPSAKDFPLLCPFSGLPMQRSLFLCLYLI